MSTYTTYTTLNVAGKILKELGYEIPASKVGGRCAGHVLNPECTGRSARTAPVRRGRAENVR